MIKGVENARKLRNLKDNNNRMFKVDDTLNL
jgi:hypothetical protein